MFGGSLNNAGLEKLVNSVSKEELGWDCYLSTLVGTLQSRRDGGIWCRPPNSARCNSRVTLQVSMFTLGSSGSYRGDVMR